MERSKTQIIIFVVVVAASLASYIFLNNTGATRADSEQTEQYDDNESYEKGDTKMLLPDVHMVKKVLETGKRLLPTS